MKIWVENIFFILLAIDIIMAIVYWFIIRKKKQKDVLTSIAEDITKDILGTAVEERNNGLLLKILENSLKTVSIIIGLLLAILYFMSL